MHIAHVSKNHFQIQRVWKDTWELTLKNDLTNALFVINPFEMLERCNTTWKPIPKKNFSSVKNALDYFGYLVVWKDTCERKQVNDLIIAQFVIDRFPYLKFCSVTCEPTVENELILVLIVKNRLHRLQTWKRISLFTLEISMFYLWQIIFTKI